MLRHARALGALTILGAALLTGCRERDPEPVPPPEQIIDPALLDPDFVAAAEESADEMRGVAAGPFPHEARAEIYDFYLREIRRHDPDVPVFLCTETPAMWADFGPQLGLTAGDYVCGCGPQSPPGTRRLEYVGAPVSPEGGR